MVAGVRRFLEPNDQRRQQTGRPLWPHPELRAAPAAKDEAWYQEKSEEAEAIAAFVRSGARGAKKQLKLHVKNCGVKGVSPCAAVFGEESRKIRGDSLGLPQGTMHGKDGMFKNLLKGFTGGHAYTDPEAQKKARASFSR